MDQTNLDICGHAPLPWSRAERQLEVAVGENVTHFLATVRPEGRPHVAGVGALWVDGKFYFTSGAGTRKSRNLSQRADSVISVKLPDLDLIVEGSAAKVRRANTPASRRALRRAGLARDRQGPGAHSALQRPERRATTVEPVRIHAEDRVRRGDS